MIFNEDFNELGFLNTIFAQGEKVFVGMTDIANEGEWVWMDGSTMTLDSLWHSYFPNGGTENNWAEYVENHGFDDILCDEAM